LYESILKFRPKRICPKCRKQTLDTIDGKTYFCLDYDCGFVGKIGVKK